MTDIWALPLTAVTVTMTPPGGSPITINTGSGSQAAAGALSAVERLDVAWSRPSPAAHDEAHESTLILRASRAAGAAIVYDARVDVRVATDGPSWPILRGWITEVTSEDLDNGQRRYTCRIRNVIGRAQASRISAASWPLDNVGGRNAAIRNAAPEIPGEVIIHNTQYVRPRRVDAVSALELHQLTAPAAGMWVAEAEGGIRYAKTPRGTTLSWQPSGSDLVVTAAPDGAVIHVLDAAHVEAKPLTLSSRHVVTSSRIGFYTSAGAAESINLEPSPRPSLPGSSWSVDTDIDDTAPARGLADLTTLANEIMAASQRPIWTLPKTRLAIGKLADPIAFTAIGTRSTIIVQISGAADERVDEVYNLVGCRFEIVDGTLRDYEATLYPNRLVGSSPVQYDAAIWGTQYETIRFDQLGSVRFAQTIAVFQGGRVL